MTAFATAQNRAILTLNRKHFIHLHNAGVVHAGVIIVCIFDADFTALAQRIHDAINQEGDLTGKLLRIPRIPVAAE